MADITLILIGIGVLLLMILLTLFGVLVYSGLFHRVDVGAGPPHVQNLIVAYKFARGPYKNSGHIFTELSNIAPDNRYIGVYYDDPYQVRTLSRSGINTWPVFFAYHLENGLSRHCVPADHTCTDEIGTWNSAVTIELQ